MTKHEFIGGLREALLRHGLDEAEAKRSTAFYAEMIDDRMEDGMSEAEAVEAMGDPEAIATEILYDKPLGTLLRSNLQKKKEHFRGKPMLIVMTILGFPIWFPLVISLLAVALSLVISLFTVIFSLVISLFAADAAILLSGLLVIPASILSFYELPIIFAVGIALLLIGIAILLFFPVKWGAKGLIRLAALLVRGVKSLFIAKSKS